MTYPIFSIPKPVFPGYCFNRDQPLICKDRLPLCNTGKFSLFPFLPQMPVHAVLLHRHMEHLACRGAVNVPAALEHLKPPPLPGNPRNHPRLNSGKICHDKLPAALRHEGRADELRERIRDILIKHGNGIKIPGFYQFPCLRQVRDMVLRQILKLNNAPAIPTGPVGAVECKHPVSPAVRAHRILHRLVFLHGGSGKLLPERQHGLQRLRRILQKPRHRFFVKGVRLHPVLRKPLFHLLHGVWVLQFRQLLQSRRQLRLGSPVHGDCVPDHLHVHADAPVVDLLILPVFLPHKFRHGEL